MVKAHNLGANKELSVSPCVPGPGTGSLGNGTGMTPIRFLEPLAGAIDEGHSDDNIDALILVGFERVQNIYTFKIK